MAKGLSILFFRREVIAGGQLCSPLVSQLNRVGHRAVETSDAEADLKEIDVALVSGSARWFPKILSQLAEVPFSERPLLAVWHLEPLPPSRASGLPRPRLDHRQIAKILLRHRGITDPYSNYLTLRKLWRRGFLDVLMVPCRGRQEFLAERGIAAEWAPFGYDSDAHGRDLGFERDIDVLFLGGIEVPRRKRMLRYLSRSDLSVRIAGSWTDPAFWGESRSRLLNRVKILLNIQRYPGELSGLRCLMAIANGTLLISEPMYRPEPYIPGEHFVSAKVEEMPHVVEHYLRHPEERERIVSAGRRLVTEVVTAEWAASRAIRAIEGGLENRLTRRSSATQ